MVSHTHDQHSDVDWASQAENLAAEATAYTQFFAAAFADLAERWQSGHVGAADAAAVSEPVLVDVGAGPGVTTTLLAQCFSAPAVAVDGNRQLLEYAVQAAAEAGVTVSTVAAGLPAEIAAVPEADVIWASHSLHHVGDQAGAVRALAGRLRTGGLLAVAEGGLPTRWLGANIGIGTPGLQERMDAARADWFTQMRGDTPNSVAAIDDWPTMLRDAGLVDIRSTSYLIDIPAPAPAVYRTMLRTRLERYRDLLDETSDAHDDRSAIAQLLDPDNPLGLNQRPDLHFLSARTVIVGRRA